MIIEMNENELQYVLDAYYKLSNWFYINKFFAKLAAYEALYENFSLYANQCNWD